MKIETKYVAEDGRIFDDPLKCQDYENTKMGVIPGTVGSLIKMLSKFPKEKYCSCLYFIDTDKGKYIHLRVTFCIDNKLCDYVNIETLDAEKRYFSCTIGELINELKMYGETSKVCGMVVVGDGYEMKNMSVASQTNQEMWDN